MSLSLLPPATDEEGPARPVWGRGFQEFWPGRGCLVTSSVPRGLPITPPHWWLHYPTPTHPAVALGGEQDPFLQGSGLACVQAQSVAESGGARVTPLAVCCLLLLSQQGPEELEGGASSKPDSSSFLQACPQPLPPFCRPLSPPCVSSALCAPGPRASIWGGGATAPTGPPRPAAHLAPGPPQIRPRCAHS